MCLNMEAHSLRLVSIIDSINTATGKLDNGVFNMHSHNHNNNIIIRHFVFNHSPCEVYNYIS